MLEKADIKIIDFDDFVFCTTESKSITFNAELFIEDYVSQRRKSQLWLTIFSLPGRLSLNELNSKILLRYDKCPIIIVG